MKTQLRRIAALLVLGAMALGSTACVVRERRDDRWHEHPHEHEEVIVR